MLPVINPEHLGLLVSTKGGTVQFRITAIGEEKFLVMMESEERVFFRECAKNEWMVGRKDGWFLFGEMSE